MRVGEERDLHLGRAGVGVVEAMLRDDPGLGLVDLLGHGGGLRSEGGDCGPAPRALDGSEAQVPCSGTLQGYQPTSRGPQSTREPPQSRGSRAGRRRQRYRGGRCRSSVSWWRWLGVSSSTRAPGLVERGLDLVVGGVGRVDAAAQLGLQHGRAQAALHQRQHHGRQGLGVLQEPRVAAPCPRPRGRPGRGGRRPWPWRTARRSRGRRGRRTRARGAARARRASTWCRGCAGSTRPGRAAATAGARGRGWWGRRGCRAWRPAAGRGTTGRSRACRPRG